MNHEHTVCSSKIENHVHEKDLDCSLHLLKQSDVSLANYSFKIIQITINKDINSLKYNYLKNHQQLSFSLRGPPLTT